MQLSSFVLTERDRWVMLTRFNSSKENQAPENDKIYFDPEDWKEQEEVDKIVILTRAKKQLKEGTGRFLRLSRKLDI